MLPEQNTIMIVDDSPIIVRKVSMMLEAIGYKVVATAANGNQAIEAYRKNRPEAVTMDITMPEMDGIEATRAIIAEFPDANIVMVTSLGQEKIVLEALQAGAKGYLIKPFKENKLFETIEKACKREIAPEEIDEEVARRKAAKKATA